MLAEVPAPVNALGRLQEDFACKLGTQSPPQEDIFEGDPVAVVPRCPTPSGKTRGTYQDRHHQRSYTGLRHLRTPSTMRMQREHVYLKLVPCHFHSRHSALLVSLLSF